MNENIKPRYDTETGTQTGGREPTTWASYEILVRRHVKPYIGKIALAKLQVEHVEQWQRQLEASGASAETRRAALVRLRTALNVAMQRSHVQRNVAELVSTPRQVRKTYEVPRAQDLRRLLEVIQGDPLESLAYLALGLGLRRAEVLGLRWEDVEFENRIVTVRARVNRLGKGIGLFVRDGLKTQPERRIAMPRLVAEVLRKRWPRQLRRDCWLANSGKGLITRTARPVGSSSRARQARCFSRAGPICTSPTCGRALAWIRTASTGYAMTSPAYSLPPASPTALSWR
jgi:integrase